MNIHEALEKTRRFIRRQHKALSTEGTYLFWLGRYMSALRHIPKDLPSEKKLEQFLTDLACVHNVAASTQNQAFNDRGAIIIPATQFLLCKRCFCFAIVLWRRVLPGCSIIWRSYHSAERKAHIGLNERGYSGPPAPLPKLRCGCFRPI